ncbi:hypothetical protein JAAARDRAFT_42675 [Jaapia argillacea MUCL 33604]|uniref:F-box domain-containing protein n=1 Tax=Jaapia argillacea MUCL 33604 TaxID=933084 RepID=A0A067PGP4_9AGAM|nr:hypothetical protein JAAARDRAFT_42675 [Jaapia argillacea MUCL 33604]
MLQFLPTEVVDAIVDNIEDEDNYFPGCNDEDNIQGHDDILSLALSCRSFAQHLIPSILHYRTIWAHLDDHRLWHHLIDHPTLCLNVRDFRIVGQYQEPRIPMASKELVRWQDDDYDENGELIDGTRFLEALRLMTRIRSFGYIWFGRCRFQTEGLDEIWEVLQLCPDLRILNTTEFPPSSLLDDDTLVKRDSSPQKIRGIETLHLSNICSNSDMLPPIPTTYLTCFLSRNALLQSVDLSFEGPYLPFDHTFGHIHLPHLYLLRLRHLIFHSEILCSFLRRNPTIVNLSLVNCKPALDITNAEPPSLFHYLKEGDLPSLKIFMVDGTEWIPVCNAKPPLGYLHGIPNKFVDDGERSQASEALRCVSSTLSSIALVQDREEWVRPLDVEWIEEVVPGVYCSRIRPWGMSASVQPG